MRQLIYSTITYESTLSPQCSAKLLIKVTDETTLYLAVNHCPNHTSLQFPLRLPHPLLSTFLTQCFLENVNH